MKIFSEVVRKYWNGELSNIADLNGLVRDIQEKYHFKEEDIPFIKDHIRVIMGLDPKGDAEFEDELDIVKNSKEIKQPIIAKIDGICEYCNEENCKCHDFASMRPIYIEEAKDL